MKRLFNIIAKNAMQYNAKVVIVHTICDNKVQSHFEICGNIGSEDADTNEHNINALLIRSVEEYLEQSRLIAVNSAVMTPMETKSSVTTQESSAPIEVKTEKVKESKPDKLEKFGKMLDAGDKAMEAKEYEAALNYYAAALDIRPTHKETLKKKENAEKWFRAIRDLVQHTAPATPVNESEAIVSDAPISDSVTSEQGPGITEEIPVTSDPFFAELSVDQQKQFRDWARENYKTGYPISTLWHPVIKDECRKMNAEIESNKAAVDPAFKNPVVNEIYNAGMQQLNEEQANDELPPPFSI